MYDVFFFSSRRRHTRYWRDWSSDVCSSDLPTDPTGVKPQLVTSWPQYERVYGGFVRGAMLPHAVRGYFENGGGACYICRIPGADGDGDGGNGRGTLALPAADKPEVTSLRLSAIEPGARLDVEG